MAIRVERRNLSVERAREDFFVRSAGEPAPFALRCGAILIDYILVVGVVALSTIIARTLGGGTRVVGSTAQMIGIIGATGLLVVNFVVLAGLTGQTVGKWATGLRIEREDRRPPGLGYAFLRHFVGYPVSLLVIGLGFLLAAFNSRGRGLHDIIAGTVVVKKRESLAPRFPR